MVKAKKYIFQKHFDGFPKETDFKLVEEELPPLKDGEFLLEAVYLSLDPYMRSMGNSTVPVGAVFMGTQVAKVIESKNSNYPVGRYVTAELGWRTHSICDGKPLPMGPPPRPIADLGKLPLSLALGTLGISGNTAYFGFLEICQPKPGETVVVTAAAGAVGSVVGQIAKIKGCTVIGIVGSDEKGKWITEDLGFDNYVNYKDKDFEKKLEAATPKGIDCFFDNVGGELCTLIMNKMNLYGRVSACGAVSTYNNIETIKVTPVHFPLIVKQLKMEGFIVSRWANRWLEGITQNKKWIEEGKLKYRETVTEGFENVFKAFTDMLRGGNIGKTIVKI